MKKYSLRKRQVVKNSEGGTDVSYQAAIEILATIWPAGGRVQAEMYGEKLKYMKNMEYSGSETMQEGDGICVFVGPTDDPDYKIVSIQPEHDPKVMMLERM